MPTRTTKRPPRAEVARHLSRYHAKRNLAVSGEPDLRPDDALPRTEVRRFVIQKHDATRLHYDFRLEMDGVLRSWAVPKGPPEKAGDRVLAVEVEDHPLAYGGFEGTIPEGNYGAGTVMLWDRGSYTVADGSPEDAYRRGKIHLALAGEKLVGEWTLVRMRPRPGDKSANWLLIKNSAPRHRAAMTGSARDHSVLSGRTMAEIATGASTKRNRARTAEAPRATTRKRTTPPRPKKEPPPRARRPGSAVPRAEFIPPMKALSVTAVPNGNWRLEIKLDGYRAVAVINDGRVELWSRNHKPLTPDYPEIVAALQALRCDNAVIDGEIVALDEQGRSRFQLLQQRGMAGARPAIVYYVFDLLQRNGRSLLRHPIDERQSALRALVGEKGKIVRCSPVFEMPAEKLLAEVSRRGLEGIIAKQARSSYEPDRRSGAWLKCKVMGEQEFVIGGFTPPKNSRPYIGAILVGYHEGKELIYAGKVGSGFDHRRLESLHREFQKRRIAACPFANLPHGRSSRFGAGMTAGEMRKVTWVKPELVAQVRFAEWTQEGLLRQPVFLGLRTDKRAKEVVREAAPLGEAS